MKKNYVLRIMVGMSLIALNVYSETKTIKSIKIDGNSLEFILPDEKNYEFRTLVISLKNSKKIEIDQKVFNRQYMEKDSILELDFNGEKYFIICDNNGGNRGGDDSIIVCFKVKNNKLVKHPISSPLLSWKNYNIQDGTLFCVDAITQTTVKYIMHKDEWVKVKPKGLK